MDMETLNFETRERIAFEAIGKKLLGSHDSDSLISSEVDIMDSCLFAFDLVRYYPPDIMTKSAFEFFPCSVADGIAYQWEKLKELIKINRTLSYDSIQTVSELRKKLGLDNTSKNF